MIDPGVRARKFLVTMVDAVFGELHGKLSRAKVNVELIAPATINIEAPKFFQPTFVRPHHIDRVML